MAGGRWTTQNKVRPGAYINVNSNSMMTAINSIRGVVTMPWVGGFGPSREVIEVTSNTDFLTVLGYDFGAPELLIIREVLKRASTLLLYRVNDGLRATINGTDGLRVVAKHGGDRGNDLIVRIRREVDTQPLFTVETFLGAEVVESEGGEKVISGRLVDVQQVTKIEELEDNAFVMFIGEGALTGDEILRLTGGEHSLATSADYNSYFQAIEAYHFNTMALPEVESTTKAQGVNIIERLREEEGKKCQLVVADFAANSEAVISVANGVILNDGTEVEKELAVAWVAGATAGANVNESNTYSSYAGAVDVEPRLTHSDTIDALRAGQFVFTERRGRVVVEQDINSLTEFTPEKNQTFSKNRAMRVLDDIANSVKQLFEDVFIGRVSNDADGRALFRSGVIEYMNTLQGMNAIQNFGASDVRIAPGIHGDSVVVHLDVQPTDAMEKLYMSVVVE